MPYPRSPAYGSDTPFDDQTDQGQAPTPAEGSQDTRSPAGPEVVPQVLGRRRGVMGEATVASAGLTEPLAHREKDYASLVGRLAAARAAGGEDGAKAELSKVSLHKLASEAEMANAQFGQAFASGRTWIQDDPDGWNTSLYTRDPNDEEVGSWKNILDDWRRRTGVVE